MCSFFGKRISAQNLLVKCWSNYLQLVKNKLYFFQHYMNMHTKGGEVKCDECGKMVKNKWYMRRHKVTHHGAPLRKAKKSFKNNNNDSDSEM